VRTRSAHHARYGLSATRALELDVDSVNYATKYATKIKAKFFYSDQIKFNESVLKPGTPEEQRITNHSLLTSSS